jgi:antitoxin component of MazEF toxin-antitoxin module
MGEVGYSPHTHQKLHKSMKFKAKIIKIGNSKGVRIKQDVITQLGLGLGDVITLEVITRPNVITQENKKPNVITSKDNVITKSSHSPFDICPKHKVFYKTCGCK